MLLFFVAFWKWKYFCFISLAIPRLSRSRIHWPINFTKTINISVYKKVTSFSGTLLFSSVLHFFLFKYTESSIFLEKLIGQWIPDRNGRGIARDIKKIVFIFKTRQKMVTKLGQFTKLGPFSTFHLFKLSKLCYQFLSSLKMEIIFFDISSNPPPIAVQNSLTNQFFLKK